MSTILVSLHGRDVGLDSSRYLTSRIGAKFPELWLGTSDAEVQVDLANFTTVTAHSTATTAGTTMTNSGIARLDSTGGLNTTYNLAAPVAGRRKIIFQAGTSTGQIVSSTGGGATMQTTGGSTHVNVTLPNRGAALTLVGLSTSVWGVLCNQGVNVFA